MKRKVFFYSATTQLENVGDLLINRSLIKMLTKRGVVYVDDENIPQTYLQKLVSGIKDVRLKSDLEPYYKFFLLRLLMQKSREVFFFAAPGHIFGLSKRIERQAKKDVLIRKILTFLGAKYVRVGFSAGPFSDVSLKHFLGLHRGFYKLLVRDSDTFDFLKQQGLNNVIYAPDLAFGYDMKEVVNAIDNSNRTTPKVVLSFRSAIFGKKTDEVYSKKIIESVTVLLKQFIGFHFVVCFQVDVDKDICLKVYNTIKNDYEVTFIDSCLSLQQACQLYAGSSIVISNRLHVLLLGMIAGSKPIAFTELDRHSKITSLFKDNELDDFLLDFNDTDSFKTKTEKILLQPDGKNKNSVLYKTIQQNRAALIKVFDIYF